MSSDTAVQFELLRELDNLFRQAGISYWLRGGWALDFLLGKITRPHSDIDLVSWKRESGHIQKLLSGAGFSFECDLSVQMDFVKAGQDISVVYVAKNEKRQIYTPDIPEWIWTADALSTRPCQLEGLACRVVSPAQLLAEKEEYEEGTGRPLRPKDVRSIAILRQLQG